MTTLHSGTSKWFICYLMLTPQAYLHLWIISSVYNASVSAITIKIHDDDDNSDTPVPTSPPSDQEALVPQETAAKPEFSRTVTGIISHRRPAMASTSNSGTSTPTLNGTSSVSTLRPKMSVLSMAKIESSKRLLYSRFNRGPTLVSELDKQIDEPISTKGKGKEKAGNQDMEDDDTSSAPSRADPILAVAVTAIESSSSHHSTTSIHTSKKSKTKRIDAGKHGRHKDIAVDKKKKKRSKRKSDELDGGDGDEASQKRKKKRRKDGDKKGPTPKESKDERRARKEQLKRSKSNLQTHRS